MFENVNVFQLKHLSVSMADPTEQAGMGMKLCVFGIAKKFPTIQNLTTSILASKMKPPPDNTQQDEAKSGKLIVLVCMYFFLDIRFKHFFTFTCTLLYYM